MEKVEIEAVLPKSDCRHTSYFYGVTRRMLQA